MNAREEALEHYGGRPPRCAWCGHTTDLEIDHIDGGQGQGNAHREAAWLMIRDYGRLAGLPVKAHPHMLRHACGFALADQGADTRLIQDYLGHRNIQHTVRYTATNPAWFERLWR
jgi:site-specific recombinase XerD